VKDHADMVLAHVIRDFLLEKGADGEVRLDGVHSLLDLLRRDGQSEVNIVAPTQKQTEK